MFFVPALQGWCLAVDQAEFLSRDSGAKSASELILVVGRTHFLVVWGLMALFP